MKVRKCPQCGSIDIVPDMGGVMNTWRCKHCGYVGSFFIEKKVDEKELKQKNVKK